MKKVMEFKMDKETKGTFRYAETAEIDEQVLRTVYVRKDKIEGEVPKALTITMETKEGGGEKV